MPMPRPAHTCVSRVLAAVALSVGAVWVAGVAGCADPESAVGFHEKDPAARLRAIRQAAATRDASAVPSLIGLLQSDDPAERLLAIGALERITGETRGYDHAAPIDERNAAVERWASRYTGTSGGGGGGRGSMDANTRAPTPAGDERRRTGS